MRSGVFDAVMAPFEHAGLGRLRRIAWAAVPDGGRGLELGAGTGANFALYPPGARVVAVDASPRLLRGARGKPGAAGALLVAADIQALPFRAGSFDWAVETLVFCELTDPAAALAETARVLRGGAPFVLFDHVRPAGWLGFLAHLVTRITAPLWGEHFDRAPAGMLPQAGFAIRRRAFLWRDVLELIVCERAAASTRAGVAAPTGGARSAGNPRLSRRSPRGRSRPGP